MKVLITGGVKSGKSRFAEQRTLELTGGETPIYLATTELLDGGMHERIAVHRQRRGKQFRTIEESLHLSDALSIPPIPPIPPLVKGDLQESHAPVLVECLTMWLNNWLHHQLLEAEAFAEIERLLAGPNDLVLVLNEVGQGILPENELARRFADLSGRLGQQLGAVCDEVWWCVAGHPLRIK